MDKVYVGQAHTLLYQVELPDDSEITVECEVERPTAAGGTEWVSVTTSEVTTPTDHGRLFRASYTPVRAGAHVASWKIVDVEGSEGFTNFKAIYVDGIVQGRASKYEG